MKELFKEVIISIKNLLWQLFLDIKAIILGLGKPKS